MFSTQDISSVKRFESSVRDGEVEMFAYVVDLTRSADLQTLDQHQVQALLVQSCNNFVRDIWPMLIITDCTPGDPFTK